MQISWPTLKRFGASNGRLVHDGEVYRLVSAIFVHITLIHFLGNIFATFVLVTMIEHTYGVVKTLIMFLLCGIGGNIFSLALDNDGFETTMKAAASTALYGFVGVVLGYLIINWVGLQLVG